MGCLVLSPASRVRGRDIDRLFLALAVVSAPCTTAQMPRNVEGPAPTPTEGPIVLEYGPTGALDTLFPTLKVRFDRQMVTPGPLGTRDAGPVFEITPSIDERVRWVGTDLVELRVLTRLPLATTFTVTFTLPEELAGTATPLRWTFSTPPPTCSFFDPRLPGSVLAQDEPLLIECTAPVDLGGLKRWVKVLADGRRFPAEVALLSELAEADAGPPSRLAELAHMLAGERAESIIVVRPRTAWPEVRRLSVLLSPDLRSREGPLVMGRPVELVAQDIPPFQVLEARCTEHGRAVEIMFSTPVPQRQLEPLTVAPALEPSSLLRHAELDPTGKSASWVYRLGMGRGSTDYTITLPAGLQDEYGQSLPAVVERSVHCPSSVFLEFEHWGGLLEPGKPRTVEISFRDIRQAQVRAVPMSADQILLQAPKFAFEWKWGRLDKDTDRRALGNHGLPLEVAGLPVVVGNIDLAGSRQGTSSPDPIWLDALDLGKYLRSGDRALWVELAAAGQVQTRALFQVTDLGLLVWASAGPGLVQAVRLTDGAALPGVAVWLAGSDGVRTDLGRTDAAGLLRIPTDEKCHDDRLLLARTPDGRWPGILEYPQMVGCADERESSLLHPGEELVGHLRTERDLYAPGDTIHFVGWAAISAPRDASGFRSVPAGARVHIELEKDRKTVIETKAVVDEHGKFWGNLPFPTDARPARYELHAHVGLRDPAGEDGADEHDLESVKLRLASFSPSDLSLNLRMVAAQALAGETMQADLRAFHRSGGSAALSRAEADLACSEWRPVSEVWSPHSHLYHPSQEVPIRIVDGGLALGHFRLAFTPAFPPLKPPLACTLSLHVYDQGSRVETAQTKLYLHPSHFYLSAEAEPAVVNSPLRISVGAHDWHDKPAAVTGVKLLLRRQRDQQVVRQQVVDIPGNGPRQLIWPALPTGAYHVEVQAADGDREVATKLVVFVDKAESIDRDEPGIELASPERVQAGARLPVQVTAPPGVRSGLLVVQRNGARAAHSLVFHQGRARLQLPIDERWYPEITLHATAVLTSKAHPPMVLSAEQQVAIDSRVRELHVSLISPESARPGQPVDVAVSVHDGMGRVPAQTRVSLWVVDEGVLALTGFEACAGLGPLATGEQLPTQFSETLSQVLQPFDLNGPPTRTPRVRAPDVIPGQADVRGEQPEPRARFETTPYFAGDLAVDGRGQVRTRFTLPHNLTTFRVTAIASAPLPGGQSPVAFGSAERPIQVSLPLLIKPILPGRMRPGDETEATALVQNLGGPDGELEVAVEVEGDGAVLIPAGETTQRAPLRRGDEIRLASRLRAGREGEARVRWRVRLRTSAGIAQEDAVELPVRVERDPQPREQTTLSGRLAAGETRFLRLALPRGIRMEQAELGLRLSASLAGETEAAVQDLLGYPYGCLEQTMSRLVPLIAAPSTTERLTHRPRDEQLRLVMARLAQFNLENRVGVAFWPNGRPDLFATVWATLLLAEGRAAHLPINQSLIADARAGLEHVLTEGQKGPRQVPDDVQALSMFALAEAGGMVPASWLDRFASVAAKEPTFDMAMAALALARSRPQDPAVRALLSTLALRLDEGQSTASVAGSETQGGLPSRSPTTVQAALLWAFARSWPDHPVVSKLTTSLLAQRSGLSWNNTFENAMALLALSSLGVLRDGPSLGSGAMEVNNVPLLPSAPLDATGRPLLRTWPLTSASPPDGRDSVAITLHAGPEGAVFYTAYVSCLPTDPDSAADLGVRISTSYRSRHGFWGSDEPLAVGEVFAIDLALQAERGREHLVVEIPLPAGAEPFDLALGHGASAIAPNLTPLRQLEVGAEELHRDRILVFVHRLPPGLVRRYTVYARAAAPGSYVVPGARAQAMYAPEVRGRAATRRVQIVPEAEER